MLVSEAFTQYIFEEVKLRGGAAKTAQNYRSTLASFINACGDLPLTLITHDAIVRWKMTSDARGIQASSIKSQLGCLRQVLRFFKKRGLDVLDWRDIQLPKVVRKEAVWLEIPELKAILDAAKNIRDQAIIATLFSCGGRIGEVLSLNRDSIVDGRAQVLGKGSKWNTLIFDDKTIDLINEYLNTRKDNLPPLFISGQYRRITVQRVEQILHILAAEAGITKNVTPHTIRHSFATDLIINGADLVAVKEHLNHSNITTTQIYTHVSKTRRDRSYKENHMVL